MNRFSEQNYIVIQGWMVSVLELKGNELILYALIYGFCQRVPDHSFHGSLKYMESAIGASRNTVLKSLRSLEEKNLIKSHEKTIYNVKIKEYSIIERGVQFLTKGGSVSAPNNIIDNLSIESKGENQENLFPGTDPKRKCLFRNSGLTIEKVASKISTDKFPNVDIEYYYMSIKNWSDTQGTKKLRTMTGWIATIRQAILRDHSAGKLVTLGNAKLRSTLDQMKNQNFNQFLDNLE